MNVAIEKLEKAEKGMNENACNAGKMSYVLWEDDPILSMARLSKGINVFSWIDDLWRCCTKI